MAIGTSAAIILGASAIGGHLVQAKLASNAAKKGAEAQNVATDKALGVSREVYDTQMAGMQPYANAGRSSVNTLSRLMQPGVPYTAAMQQEDARTMNALPPMPALSPSPPPTGGRPMTGAPFGTARPRSLGASMAPPSAIPPQQPSATVQLRAPDGTVSAVPAQLADQFVARGATRL